MHASSREPPTQRPSISATMGCRNSPHRAVHQPSVVRRLLSVGPDGGELGDVCAGAVHPQHLCGGSAIFHNTIFLPDCRPLAISDTTQSAGRADGACSNRSRRTARYSRS